MGHRMAYVPAQLAESGSVPLPERDVMRAVGQLYQQMQAVNLLGAALDVPDAMAAAPSNIRTLYKVSRIPGTTPNNSSSLAQCSRLTCACWCLWSELPFYDEFSVLSWGLHCATACPTCPTCPAFHPHVPELCCSALPPPTPAPARLCTTTWRWRSGCGC